MKNAERLILSSVRRYATARGIGIVTHGDGWIAELKLGPRSHFIHGYDVGLNPASSHRIANDKAATFEVLNAAGIPAVPHRLFMHPRFLKFMLADGSWQGLLEAFDAFERDVVVKDNEGTGGMEMARVKSVADLEERVQQLFNTTRGIAVSPFLEIASETRFVFLDGECVLAYGKERPSVTGDGKRSLAALIADASASGNIAAMPDSSTLDLARTPKAGETIALGWQHNLGQGAKAVRIDVNDQATAASRTLAHRAFDRLGLRFASIDIVQAGGRDLVLEANSGVMLEVMARGTADGEALADGIYRRALDLALAQ